MLLRSRLIWVTLNKILFTLPCNLHKLSLPVELTSTCLKGKKWSKQIRLHFMTTPNLLCFLLVMLSLKRWCNVGFFIFFLQIIKKCWMLALNMGKVSNFVVYLCWSYPSVTLLAHLWYSWKKAHKFYTRGMWDLLTLCHHLWVTAHWTKLLLILQELWGGFLSFSKCSKSDLVLKFMDIKVNCKFDASFAAWQQ